MSGIRGLILDFGGVLTYPQPESVVQAMASRLAVSKDVFEHVYWEHRPAYDAGLSGQEYWQRVLAGLGRKEGTHSLIQWLIERDIASWTVYREETWDLARAFRAAGGRTACLSNGVLDIMTRVRSERPLGNWFDVVVVSCDVGLTKPDRRIYELCLDRLGIRGHEALFVDDRRANVDGARQAGLQALYFTGEDALSSLQACLLDRPG
jgi:putative hydrolase of the HAD superfamily